MKIDNKASMRSYKPYIIKLCIVFLCFWGWILTGSAQKVETNDYFYVLNTQQGLSGQFYQIRTGRNEKNKTDASIFLHFNPETRKYSWIFACNYILHTLNMSSDNQALISSQHGYLMFDFKLGITPREVKELPLQPKYNLMYLELDKS